MEKTEAAGFACIDIDSGFEAFLKEWMTRHRKEYKTVDQVEERMPEIYEEYLNTPASVCGGLSPAVFFKRFDDADQLVKWLLDYHKQGIAVPDLLLQRITELGPQAAEKLTALVQNEAMPEELRLTACSLLTEMDSMLPMGYYLRYIQSLESPNPLGDAFTEALRSMDESAAEAALPLLPACGEAGKDYLADILCTAGHDERIYNLLIERFAGCRDQRAFYACCLGKYGDERAIPVLARAALESDVNYLDYIEMINAIESLGGERPAEREFSGDPYYESLKMMG